MPQDRNTIWLPQTITAHDFQLTGMFGEFLTADPNTALMLQTSVARGDGNEQRWSDAEVDAIVAKQQVEFDLEKRRQLIFDAQRLLFKKFTPRLVVYTSFVYSAYWSYYHPPRQQGITGILARYGHYGWTEKA